MMNAYCYPHGSFTAAIMWYFEYFLADTI